jgi:hypothetical protein
LISDIVFDMNATSDQLFNQSNEEYEKLTDQGVERHTLWSEFYAQLSEEKKTAYSQTSREKTKSIRIA